jgi:hypothetical protein
MQWAVNLAASVKFYSPDLHVTLLHDGCFDSLPEDEKTVFDTEIEIEKTDYFDDGFQPGLAKLSLYKYFKHDENIFIDADSICIADLNTLFDACNSVDIGLQVYNVAKTKDEWQCKWATWEQLKEWYGLENELSEINSSFIYSKKNKTAEKFWKQARKNYIKNLETLWAGKFPDELAFDVATAQTGISGKFGKENAHYPVAMTSSIDGERLGIDGLKNYCLIMSYWGGRYGKYAHHYKNYDLQANHIHKQIFGKQNPYKHQRLMQGKIVHKAGVRLLNESRKR